MFKYYNPQLVKKYRSYTAEEICKLFENKRLHVQTIREWVKSGELEVITKKPITIYPRYFKMLFFYYRFFGSCRRKRFAIERAMTQLFRRQEPKNQVV